MSNSPVHSACLNCGASLQGPYCAQCGSMTWTTIVRFGSSSKIHWKVFSILTGKFLVPSGFFSPVRDFSRRSLIRGAGCGTAIRSDFIYSRASCLSSSPLSWASLRLSLALKTAGEVANKSGDAAPNANGVSPEGSQRDRRDAIGCRIGSKQWLVRKF